MVKYIFPKIDLFDLLAWTFFKFMAHCVVVQYIMGIKLLFYLTFFIFLRLHDRQLWSAQTSSDLKLPQESDSDSINDYAGGTVGEFALLYTNFSLLQCNPLISPCTL